MYDSGFATVRAPSFSTVKLASHSPPSGTLPKSFSKDDRIESGTWSGFIFSVFLSAWADTNVVPPTNRSKNKIDFFILSLNRCIVVMFVYEENDNRLKKFIPQNSVFFFGSVAIHMLTFCK
jgi:hypothetical protein